MKVPQSTEGFRFGRRVSLETTHLPSSMKTLKTLLACFAVVVVLGFASYGADSKPAEEAAPPPKLTRFDLDFPGGTPGDLVASIEKASGRPLNMVIPSQFSEIILPPLKMRNVDAAQLFEALSHTSGGNYQTVIDNAGKARLLAYGIATSGKASNDSIWYLQGNWNDAGNVNDRLCRFFLLEPFLDHGLTVDDITTAIQTAWKMMGDPKGAQLSYHPETKLLIVVSDQKHIDVIAGALDALRPFKANSASTDSSIKSTVEKKP